MIAAIMTITVKASGIVFELTVSKSRTICTIWVDAWPAIFTINIRHKTRGLPVLVLLTGSHSSSVATKTKATCTHEKVLPLLLSVLFVLLVLLVFVFCAIVMIPSETGDLMKVEVVLLPSESTRCWLLLILTDPFN